MIRFYSTTARTPPVGGVAGKCQLTVESEQGPEQERALA